MTTARGSTLIEVMVAMGILMIGAAGVVGLQLQSQFFQGDARRVTRASYIAQDLANQIQLWPFDDPRLADVVDSDDLTDNAGAFLLDADPPADHDEADLGLDGRAWNGIPGAALGPGMERFWSVDYADDANENGVPDSVRVGIVVRWPESLSVVGAGPDSGYRRYVFYMVKVNPEDRR